MEERVRDSAEINAAILHFYQHLFIGVISVAQQSVRTNSAVKMTVTD